MSIETRTLPPIPAWSRSRRLRLLLGLAPVVIFGAIIVGWLAYTLFDQTRWWHRADEANVREWLDESRIHRKSLPELAREYVALHRQAKQRGMPFADDDERRAEIAEQLAALTDPTRLFATQLPLFPEVYRITVIFDDPALAPIEWNSPAPRPRQTRQIRSLSYPLFDGPEPIGQIEADYRVHAFDKSRRDEEEQTRIKMVVIALVGVAGVLAAVWLSMFLARERRRELNEWRIRQEKEHAERLLLEQQLRIREAEHAKEELDRKLLEQSLETARQESRAAAAERAALELKSQLYASIGIMAGSYAHNIKNLLVRPNDLLARCLEADRLSPSQEAMLHEVRQTLGVVTERLQQILRTVRRDPTRTEMTRLDLNILVAESVRTWQETARDKWKLVLQMQEHPEPLWIQGDASHLQQAIENMIFNARDATFEMRNFLRDQARQDPKLSDAARRQAVLAAAAWKGEVVLRTRAEGPYAILEVQDNGIGMSDDIRRQCTQAHFSTKRDNALYEGLSAGMGLGLSFVAVVIENHRAELEIDSQPRRGTTFRIRFRRVDPPPGDNRHVDSVLERQVDPPPGDNPSIDSPLDRPPFGN